MNNRRDETARREKLAQTVFAFVFLVPIAAWVFYICTGNLMASYNTPDLIGASMSAIAMITYLCMLIRGVVQYKSTHGAGESLVSINGN